MIKKLVFILLIVPIQCIGDGFLIPGAFPTTASDISFTDRYALKSAGYESFANLSAYDKLNIVESDYGIPEELAQDEYQDEIEYTPLVSYPPADPTSPPQSVYPPAVPQPVENQFCAAKNPAIPSGQTVPIGKPVLESDYKFCSKYGVRNFGTPENPRWDNHYGFDIGCTEAHFDRPVFTAADGIVDRVQPNRKGSSAGNYIRINHQNGFVTYYMHLNQMLVTQGQRVYAGCQIGTIGNTGGAKINQSQYANNEYPTMRKSISHLHYEMHYTGNQTSVSGIPIRHGFPNHKSIDPAYFMGVK